MDKTTGRADARQEASVSPPHVLTELLAMSGRLAVLEAEKATGVQAFRAIFERMTVAIERMSGGQSPAPRKSKRLTSEVERHEREQRACMFLKQLGPNKTAIAEALGWSRGTLDKMPLFCQMFDLMSQPSDGPAMSDQSDSEGTRAKRYRRDRASD